MSYTEWKAYTICLCISFFFFEIHFPFWIHYLTGKCLCLNTCFHLHSHLPLQNRTPARPLSYMSNIFHTWLTQQRQSSTFFFLWRCSPTRTMASSFLMRFLDHTQRRTTVGRIPLYEGSARRRYLYLTTHNIHNRLTSMPPAGFEPTISAGKRPQT